MTACISEQPPKVTNLHVIRHEWGAGKHGVCEDATRTRLRTYAPCPTESSTGSKGQDVSPAIEPKRIRGPDVLPGVPLNPIDDERYGLLHAMAASSPHRDRTHGLAPIDISFATSEVRERPSSREERAKLPRNPLPHLGLVAFHTNASRAVGRGPVSPTHLQPVCTSPPSASAVDQPFPWRLPTIPRHSDSSRPSYAAVPSRPQPWSDSPLGQLDQRFGEPCVITGSATSCARSRFAGNSEFMNRLPASRAPRRAA